MAARKKRRSYLTARCSGAQEAPHKVEAHEVAALKRRFYFVFCARLEGAGRVKS